MQVARFRDLGKERALTGWRRPPSVAGRQGIGLDQQEGAVAGSGRTSSTPAVTLSRVPFAAFADPWPLAAMRQGPSGRGMVLPARVRRPVTVSPTTGASAAKAGPATMASSRANHGTRAMSLRVMTAPTAGEGGVNTASWSSSDPVVECQRAFRRIFSSFPTLFRHGCEPKLWDQAAAFDDASGWLRLAGADGLSASAAQ